MDRTSSVRAVMLGSGLERSEDDSPCHKTGKGAMVVRASLTSRALDSGSPACLPSRDLYSPLCRPVFADW